MEGSERQRQTRQKVRERYMGKYRTCCRCAFSKRDEKGDYVCGNPESDNYSDWIFANDSCEDFEEDCGNETD